MNFFLWKFFIYELYNKLHTLSQQFQSIHLSDLYSLFSYQVVIFQRGTQRVNFILLLFFFFTLCTCKIPRDPILVPSLPVYYIVSYHLKCVRLRLPLLWRLSINDLTPNLDPIIHTEMCGQIDFRISTALCLVL